ncbi:hypothetical protein [Zhihengliuella sp.]|uniref:hypothetical protein n=1 Tax=Zhihengliuella sp. TaxID=1954483 RepID=UPI002810B7D6|nr:hypothetical protein [Zhihengliuella sp.]
MSATARHLAPAAPSGLARRRGPKPPAGGSGSPSQCGLVARRMVAIGLGVIAMGVLLVAGALSAVGALLATAV